MGTVPVIITTVSMDLSQFLQQYESYMRSLCLGQIDVMRFAVPRSGSSSQEIVSQLFCRHIMLAGVCLCATVIMQKVLWYTKMYKGTLVIDKRK
jgi:hypothetical protein